MPYPRKDEDKAHYIARCIKQVMAEGRPQKEAVGRCHGMWKTYGTAKKTIKKGSALEVT